MGAISVAKSYDVVYDNKNLFSSFEDEFFHLLKVLDVAYTDINDNEFEVDRKSLEKGLDRLTNIDCLDEDDKARLEDALDDFIYTPQEIASYLKFFLEESDQRHNFLHFCID